MKFVKNISASNQNLEFYSRRNDLKKLWSFFCGFYVEPILQEQQFFFGFVKVQQRTSLHVENTLSNDSTYLTVYMHITICVKK